MDASHLNDLLSRIALHDRQALRALYDTTAGLLLAVAMRLLNDRAAAEDILQEVFVSVWSRADRQPELRLHPMAWLTAMVRNRAIDVLRRKRPEVPMQWHDADGEAHEYDAPDATGAPPDLIQAAQSDQQLGDCMGQLDAEPRQAVLLAYYEGLTHADLAQRLGKPLGTIKAWVRRSLARLKDCLGELA